MRAGGTATGTEALRSRLGAGSAPEAGALVGLEHEYKVSRGGTVLDFGEMIHELAVPGRRLDPGDRNAYRCGPGLALTCDDREAEVASPPLPLGPTFTSAVDGWAHAGLALLDQVLPADVDVVGYSTHLSAAMPDRHADRVVDQLARRFAPALMMVLDGPGAHGIFLRPRPARTELCGDYVIGNRLRAATALFAGAVRACAAADRRGAALPPALAVHARLAVGRYGLEIDRHHAFGFDLYDRARCSVLPRQDGGTITAQAHLELAWGCARSALGPGATLDDLAPMDRIVGGSSPLGVEGVDDGGPASSGGSMATTPFGRLLGPRSRGTFDVAPVVATWSFTVFGLRAAGQQRFVCVPRAGLARFLDLLDTGALDDILAAHARSTSAGRVLSAFAQTQHAGLWDAIGDPADLLPPERDRAPAARAGKSGRDAGGRRPASAAARPGKPATSLPTAPVPVAAPATLPALPPVPPGPGPVPLAGRRRSRPVAVVLGALLLALVAATAFALGLFSGSPDRIIESSATTTSTEPVTSMVAPTMAAPTTTEPTTTSTAPAPSTTAAPGPTPTVTATITTPPTTSSVPPTTVPTTVPPLTTTVPPTTTTLPGPATVSVDNCAFTPATLSRPRGSIIRFRNDSPTASITLTVTGPPGSSDVFFSLDPGGLSGPYVLNVVGTYAFQCRGAGTGQMAVTAT